MLGLVLPPGVPQRGLKLCRLLGWNKWFSLSLFLWEREMKTDHGPGQWVREVVAAPSSTIGHQQVFGWSSGGQSWARSLQLLLIETLGFVLDCVIWAGI